MADEEKAWEHIIRVVEPEFDFRHTALVVIDLQNSFAKRDCGLWARLEKEGLAAESAYAIDRLEDTVIPNVARIAQGMRDIGSPVVFVRCASMRGDGSDQTARHRAQGLVVAETSYEAQIVDELNVQDSDIVLTKSGSGSFTSTNLDHILRNMGIDSVILTGMWTNSCVETTARHAGDLDYKVILVEDACVAMTPENHDWAIKYLNNNFAVVRSTSDVMQSVEVLSNA